METLLIEGFEMNLHTVEGLLTAGLRICLDYNSGSGSGCEGSRQVVLPDDIRRTLVVFFSAYKEWQFIPRHQ